MEEAAETEDERFSHHQLLAWLERMFHHRCLLYLRKEEVQPGLDAASLGLLLWTQRCRGGTVKGRAEVFHN